MSQTCVCSRAGGARFSASVEPAKVASPSQPRAITSCGLVALAGRPNVGKSTLMNHLLGRKLAITSRKPQTTRHALIGVHNHDGAQIIFVDTPGIHAHRGRALNRYMVAQAVGSLTGVDLAVLLVEARGWLAGDDLALRRIAEAAVPCVCVINKIDKLAAKERLLPLIDAVRAKHAFEEIVPVSALKNISLGPLAAVLAKRMPKGSPLYPADRATDRSLDFLVAEIVREKVIRRLGAELPHETTVVAERVVRAGEKKPSVGATKPVGGNCEAEVDAVIYVERETQKRITIGKRGAMLKSIGEDARRDIEALIGGKIMLRLWVKVDRRWSDRPDALRRFGYTSKRRVSMSETG